MREAWHWSHRHLQLKQNSANRQLCDLVSTTLAKHYFIPASQAAVKTKGAHIQIMHRKFWVYIRGLKKDYHFVS